jgi:chromosome segregation ATPase
MSTPSADRLTQISTELAGILESRIQELVGAMKSAEQSTRQIVSTEMEIARYRQVAEALAGDRESIQKESEQLKARAEEARAEHAALVGERDRLRDEVTAAERALTAQREENKGLQDAADALTKETGDLRSRSKALEENVVRMRKMREELLSGIGNLTRDMSQLGLGSKD